jgi:hypothetical protein
MICHNMEIYLGSYFTFIFATFDAFCQKLNHCKNNFLQCSTKKKRKKCSNNKVIFVPERHPQRERERKNKIQIDYFIF